MGDADPHLHKDLLSKSKTRALSAVLRIPDPDFYPSLIPDLGSRIQQKHQKRRGENICCSHKYHKIVNNFILEQVKKYFLAKTPGIIVLFIQNMFIQQ